MTTVVLAVLLLTQDTAQDTRSTGGATGPSLSISMEGCYWRAFPHGDMVITRGSEPGSGSLIHLGQDLDLEPADLGQAALSVSLGDHRVTVSYLDLGLSGQETLDHPIIFHGATFPAADTVRTDLRMPCLSVGYDYRVLGEGEWDLRIGVAMLLFSFSARLRDATSNLDERRSYTRGVPALTSALNVETGNWHVRLDGRLGYLDSDHRFSGGGQPVAGLRLWGWLDAEIGYRWERFDASAETNRINLTVHGPLVSLGARF